MDIALRNALDGLRKAGARHIPEPSVVENSPAGSRWHGIKRDGDRWYLVKHSKGSYNAEF